MPLNKLITNDTEQDMPLNKQQLAKLIPNEMPANFCIAPFQSIRQNPYGKNSPCAFGAGEWLHGALTPEERWDSAELNKLRGEFIKGQRSAECHRCWAEEDSGKKSLRQRQLEYFPNDYEDFIKTQQWLAGPKTAVFKVSNVCNLACRSCAGWDSNTYTKEGLYYGETYKTTMSGKDATKIHNRFIPVLPPKHMDFSQYFNIAGNLEKIDFFGGEPFLNMTQLALLEHLVEQGLSKNITLFYSTNCSVRPPARFKRVWDKFKRLEISMSIDGIGDEFEYLRWPGNWSQTTEIIKEICDLKNSLACEVYTMGAVTISLMNVMSADKLLAWITENIGEYYISMVNSPAYLAVHNVPDDIKPQLLATIQNDDIRGHMQYCKYNPVLWQQFIIWMKRQDIYRIQQFGLVFPEYYTIIKKHWDAVTDLSEKQFHNTSCQ